jgi:Tol biopolymer transport system component
MKLWLLLLTGCSMTVQRPVVTTEASEDLAQVTRSRGNEIDPAVSPDGRAIAYAELPAPGRKTNVEVAPLADTKRVLYGGPGRDPTWMPDSSGIVFVGKDKLVQTFGGILPTQMRPVFLADVGNPRLLGVKPSVSPDGKTVAMSIAPVGVRKPGWPTTKELDQGIGLTDMLGTGVDVTLAGTDPAFSPDGKRIVYVKQQGTHAHLFLANADGSDAHSITEGAADDQDPSWSPDGKHIVFCSAHGTDEWTQANLFTVKPDGSGIVQLTEGDRLACHPVWGKDGYVYFHANIESRDTFHIYRIRVRLPDEGAS